MIKLFRQFRAQMLANSSTKRYILYAIGEIVLVVLGILIALQINNWNQSRQNIKLERNYINRIVNELKEDTMMMNSHIRSSNSAILSGILLDSLLEEDNFEDQDIEMLLYDAQSLGRTFVPSYHTNTYDDLVNTGNFSIFRNREVVDSIQLFYSSLPWTWNDIFDSRNEELRKIMTDILPLEYHLRVLDPNNLFSSDLNKKILSDEDALEAIEKMKNHPNLDFHVKNVTRAHAFNVGLMTSLKRAVTELISYLKTTYNLDNEVII